MSQQPPDPVGWPAELMKAQRTVLWPIGEVLDTSEAPAAARPCTKAVADFTAWQLIPNARQAVMDNCGHRPHYENIRNVSTRSTSTFLLDR